MLALDTVLRRGLVGLYQMSERQQAIIIAQRAAQALRTLKLDKEADAFDKAVRAYEKELSSTWISNYEPYEALDLDIKSEAARNVLKQLKEQWLIQGKKSLFLEEELLVIRACVKCAR